MKAENRIRRTRAFMAENGIDALVVRSTSDLTWLTGFSRVFDSEQAHTGIVTQDECVIHTDSRYATAMKTAATEEGLWRVHDEPASVASFVGQTLRAAKLQAGRACIDDATPVVLHRALCSALPGVGFDIRTSPVQQLRAVKEPDELECMKRAQAVASAAFMSVLETLAPGMTESEVSLELEWQMRTRGADELAFANIVASGSNSANPHAIPGWRQLQRGDFVVFDFGAKVGGYCSDTTRTVCIGTPDEMQLRVYDAVRRANETVQAHLKAGVTGKEMHELAESVLAEAGFAGKMGHGLGHGVGLDIHEMPLLSPRYDRPLEPGNVVTVEPGVYLAGRCGARLEDYGVVTEDGYMNFCGLTHELMVVE